MQTWHASITALGMGLFATIGFGLAVWVAIREVRDTTRRVDIRNAIAKLRQWADKNRYTVLFQEQVKDCPPLKNGRAHLVFRVVVEDPQGERKWARVVACPRFEVYWVKPERWFAAQENASVAAKDNPLWDQTLDT